MTDKPLEGLSKKELIALVQQFQQQLKRDMVSREIDAEGSYVEGTVKVAGGGDWVGGSKGLDGAEVSQIIDTLLKHFPESILQPAQLDNTLAQIVTYHEKLYEWKELHNYLDMILNAFSPFAKQVERSEFSRKIPDTRELLNYWYPISERIESFLLWAAAIHHIGARYAVNVDKSMQGERWAVRISKLKNDIEGHLGISESSDTRALNPYPRKIQRQMFRVFGFEIDWWRELGELSRIFEHAATEQMHFADKKLREAATELYNLSQRSLLRVSPVGGEDHE